MTRSYRKPSWYCCRGAHPDAGKRETNRTLRAQARALTHRLLDDPDAEDFLNDPRDKIRGKKGSRSKDWGWTYFGDGFCVDWIKPTPLKRPPLPIDEGYYERWVKLYSKLSRK